MDKNLAKILENEVITDKTTTTTVLDHLGIIAAMIDKLDLIRIIDEIVPMNASATLTLGERVAALILNGLYFMNDRLYIFPDFLENKPVEKLFNRKNIKATDFNEDSLGRGLDKIYEYGESNLFSEIALKIALRFKLLSPSLHFDTTTLTVFGDYDAVENQNSSTDKNLARPEYGYAKNKRHDLKQMTLLLATAGANGFPLWFESHSGNASDKTTLQEAAQKMQNFCKSLSSDLPSMLFVGDSAMYENCAKNGDNLLWLSRVPETSAVAKNVVAKQDQDIKWERISEDYKICLIDTKEFKPKERWLLVDSEHAKSLELKTLDKNIEKDFAEATKTAKSLEIKGFACDKDIEKFVIDFSKKVKYHTITYTTYEKAQFSKKGRPKKTDIPDVIVHKVICTVNKNYEKIEIAKSKKGRFILATNELDNTKLPYTDFLSAYKSQSKTESGFKFIKNNTFEVDSIFLKKPSRISALMMVMCLCLMVYAYSQMYLRQQLNEKNEAIPDQKKRLTKKPTMQWVCRQFHGIHILNIKFGGIEIKKVLNLTSLLKRIISYFGPMACNIYNVSI